MWVPEDFLTEVGVEPFSDLPLWLKSADAGFMTFSNARAVAAGLRTRPIEQTLSDVWDWDRERGLPALHAGMSPDRQVAVLEAWERRQGS